MLEQEFINGSNDPVLIKNVRQACLEFNGIHARKNNAVTPRHVLYFYIFVTSFLSLCLCVVEFRFARCA